jgi:leader peptidase (prepilin peptidase)/N-methyltransferase
VLAHSLVPLMAALAGLLAGAAIAGSLDRFYSTSPADASRDRTREGTGPSSASTRPAPLRSQWGRFRSRLVWLAPSGAMLWGACALRAQGVRHFLLMAAFGTVLLALSATDFERHLLPNRVMYPALLAAFALSAVWPQRPPYSGVAGGLAGSAIMLALFLILPGFGLGDVKLAGLSGLILGFPGVLAGLLIGMVLGGVGAAWMLLSGRARLRSAIAYGPYLACGAILEMLLRR